MEPAVAPDRVNEQMRADWNRRAREDAHYYVAFGARNQTGDEFFATAHEQVEGLRRELRRLPEGRARARRALEIGCGPGRLMRPLSRWFGEIHGVDISDEMIARARENLEGISHAHAHVAADSNLAAFADDSFDFVYSYAVFQHIPSRGVIFGYLQESRRVLRCGGILRCQLNGLPPEAKQYDTWSGARIAAGDLATFARENDMQLLALEGAGTQYMWTTMRKRPEGWFGMPRPDLPLRGRIRRITNAHSSEPVAPVKGRFAALSVWLEKLPEDSGLNFLRVTVAEREAPITYLGHPDPDGLQQLNVYLPDGLPTGLAPVEVFWGENRLCDRRYVRLIGPPPAVPCVVSVRDGVNLSSNATVTSGVVKVTIEEAEHPEQFAATLAGRAVGPLEIFRTHPRTPQHEINFSVPLGLPAGDHPLDIRLGRRSLGRFTVAVH
jgi:SAM-dependent methyltransferase